MGIINDLLNNSIALESKTDSDDNYVEGNDDYQIDQVPKTYVLIDNWWDVICKNLPKNMNKLRRFIGEYRSKNIDKLETPYPTVEDQSQKGYPIWTPSCSNIIYECAGIDKEAFIKDVLTIRGLDGYIDKFLKDKSDNILLLLLIRWCIMKKDNNDKEILFHYLGYSHYWQVYTTYFKLYTPSLEVMMYTINEMSYKSKLKSLGSVDAWLADGIANTCKTYEERILRGSDFELHYINEKMRGKFSSAMKTLFRAVEKNEKAGNRIFISKDYINGGDEGDIKVENTYGAAEEIALATKYTQAFFANPVDEVVLQNSLVPGGITKRDLRNTIENIAYDRKNINDVNRLYQSLFHLFLDNTNYTAKDVGGVKFYIEMKKLYKPGNSNDPNKTFIKEILDKWLKIGSAAFRSTHRSATITTFRKSIYEYFILKIMADK